MNASIGGSRSIKYTENMHRINDSMKKDLEKKTDYPTNLVIYIGYSFWEHIMIKYIFILFISILLLSGCGDKLSTSSTDESANITKSLLTGSWTAKCCVHPTTSTSSKTVLVFSASGDNLTATTTNYSDLSCGTQSSVFTKKLNTLVLGSKTTTSQNQIINKLGLK